MPDERLSAVGIQDRDYYVDKLRQAQGYIERAAFRVNLGQLARSRERQEAARGWAWLLRVVLAVIAAAVLLMYGLAKLGRG